MNYTKQEIIEQVCDIVGMAYHSIGDYTHACDCFCGENTDCGYQYENDGITVDYVRKAVLNQLKKDGYHIHDKWDVNTGKYIGGV